MNHAPLVSAMIEHEAGCPQRARHFLAVTGYAKAIAGLEGLTGEALDTVEAAAITHDIGIKPSLEKYGDGGGAHQQREGPPLARAMLAGLGYPAGMIDRVCFLISKHHTTIGVDSMDWQILLEADYLVNALEGEHSRQAIRAFERKVFKTAAGRRMLTALYPGPRDETVQPGMPERPSPVDPAFLAEIAAYLEGRGQRYQGAINEALDQRAAGQSFGTTAHVRALLYAQLSDQTQWQRIQKSIGEIDALFHQYDIDSFRDDSAYYSDALFALKCGSRKTKRQMENLSHNLDQLRRLIEEYGSLDAFVLSAPAPEIVEKLSASASPYKLKYVGEALAWEYLRNVGIDGAKPDLHLRRFFGAGRLGASARETATTAEVLAVVARLSQQTGLRMLEVDNLIWSFCADGYGQVCTAAPKCEECPIRRYCNS